jgi:hypothetical protein
MRKAARCGNNSSAQHPEHDHVTLAAEPSRHATRSATEPRSETAWSPTGLKVLCLAVRNLEEFRSPNTAIRSSGWKQALQAFTIYFDGRIPAP